ncbi:Mis6-domain-containing protein [Podospora appendiculata]|uniref:Mis6-domain-containing protein n=1 Tax=Podospora appendiculata TaxID=314037 RepID=A0AAE0X400_9PEZI|nr:Mis6-domain-containing protein [Podospora appendiculata]
MASPPQGDDDLNALLGDLETASKLPAKRRQVGIKPTVEAVTSALYDRGALPDELARLVDLVTVRSHLDQASLGAIIRNLYPSRKVDDKTVLKLVGSLGHGELKPAWPIQSLSLRWLIMVYYLLENSSILSQVYAVLFNLLDTAAIRPQLCHLLALITRRKHVKPFRIQAVLELSRQTGSDPPLTGLLRVFKNYYPEIIVGEAVRGRASAFKHPDIQWRQRLDKIQQQRFENPDEGPRNGFAVNHALGRQMKGGKILFPAVFTQHAQENSVTLEEIDSADSFVENLEKIELPTQLVAVLADPLLQKLLLLRPDAEGFARISNWVAGCMSDVANGDADSDLLLDMIDVIHSYARSTRTLPPLLLTFFREFFTVWNGLDKKDMVLETLSYAPLMDFKQLHQSLLTSLEASLLDNTAASQVSLLNYYTSLLRCWAVTIQAEENPDTLPLGSVSDLIGHVNKLTLTLTQTAPSVATYLAILDFYECSAAIFSQQRLLQHISVAIPPGLVVYTLHFNHSLEVISRLCGILATYKRAWEAIMSPALSQQLTKSEREQVNTFNAFLMDLCNCLWRGRAFATSDLNAQGCCIPRSIEPALERYLRSIDPALALGSAFGLSHSPVLSLQAISYMRQLEDAEIEENELRARHAGPVTQSSLAQLGNKGGMQLSWQAYRSGVLKFLEAKGFKGFPELMYNTMKNLMKERHQA